MYEENSLGERHTGMQEYQGDFQEVTLMGVGDRLCMAGQGRKEIKIIPRLLAE